MRLLRDARIVAPYDTYLAAKFKAAGFICIGKTNTPELGLNATTEPEAFGPTRNPWDTTRSTGGSSGGSAAAVASRMVAVAHANDGGGSIRSVYARDGGLLAGSRLYSQLRHRCWASVRSDWLRERNGFEPPVPVVRSEVAGSRQLQFLRHDRRRA
jgi:hypothetical protein